MREAILHTEDRGTAESLGRMVTGFRDEVETDKRWEIARSRRTHRQCEQRGDGGD
jgi:hypothetical protein